MNSSERGLNQIQMSAVQEMANIGLGNAVTALATLTNFPFNITVPSVETVPLQQVHANLADSGELSVAVFTQFCGDVQGYGAFVFPWDSAQRLWEMLIGMVPETPADVDELSSSVMLEIGNILTASFINAISEMAGVEIHVQPPVVGIDATASLIGAVVVEAEMSDSVALSIETSILGPTEGQTTGYFLCIPTVASLQLLMSRLGLEEAA